MKWTWIGLFVRVVAVLQVFQFEFCRASEHSKKLQMYDFISKDGCGRTISKGMNIRANEMDAVPEYSIWNLGERILATCSERWDQGRGCPVLQGWSPPFAQSPAPPQGSTQTSWQGQAWWSWCQRWLSRFYGNMMQIVVDGGCGEYGCRGQYIHLQVCHDWVGCNVPNESN